MSVPEFFEARHPLVQALSSQSDRELVYGFQQHRDQGKYFTAIFCRYAGLSYVLIRNMARAALQADYLFAKVWRNIFFELTYLDPGVPDTASGADNFSLQTWIFNKTALCINQEEAPAIESIQYTLDVAPPPLWCYLQLSLDRLPALHRLILVLSQTFHWSESRIVGFLDAEGESIPRDSIPQMKTEAYQQLLETLPDDIRCIYFNETPADDTLIEASLPFIGDG
ncbi:MAG: sigma-70 family RNA polymerase sigma factor [Thermosynechococcaceae cyanobacterium]